MIRGHLVRCCWWLATAALLTAAAAPAVAAEPRALGPGDVLAITVVGEPDLTGEFTIGEDGLVNFPILGAVRLGVHSLGDAVETLRAEVEKVHRNPVITIKVARPRSATISVIGEVGQPGQVTLPLPATVIEAIAAAGGFAERADAEQVTWVHAGQSKVLDLTLPAAGIDQVSDRDVLLVAKRAMGMITVAGAVLKEGIYPLDPAQPLRLSQAVPTAGGPTPLAALEQVVLTRADGSKQIVNLKAGPEGIGPDGQILLRDGDIVYVPLLVRGEHAVYVLGAAETQGIQDFREGMTLLEVLAAAKPMPYANLNEVAIHRKGDDGQIVKISGAGAVRGKGPDIPLQRNDLVVIPGSPPNGPRRDAYDLMVPLIYLFL